MADKIEIHQNEQIRLTLSGVDIMNIFSGLQELKIGQALGTYEKIQKQIQDQKNKSSEK